MKLFKPHLNTLIATILMVLFTALAYAQGPYAPNASQPGTTAMGKDSSAFVAWATGIELHRGYVNHADTSTYDKGANRASFGQPALALGPAQGNSTHAVSLGDSGVAILTFDRPITNGPGPDFAVFENGFAAGYLELALVEVSSNGTDYVRFSATSLTDTNTQKGAFDALDATNLNNLAGKYMQGYGTPFDLDELKNEPNLDVNNIRFVKLIDVIGGIGTNPGTYDAQGHRINDPFPTASHTAGFDLEAVGIINGGLPYLLQTLDTLPLAQVDTFWNGSDGSGGFTDGILQFANNYNAAWSSWSGFAYSNMRNDTTAGWTNQYSAITAGGMHAPDSGGSNYAVAFASPASEISFADATPRVFNGMYVTNATYAYLSMKNGDAVAKKFGGPNGNDPDYFKLSAVGYDAQGNPKPDSVHLFLADFRFADNSKDYIVNTWQYLNLEPLGEVRKIAFSLTSSDMGQWGMNTPAYFCADNISVQNATITAMHNQAQSQPKGSIKAYGTGNSSLAIELTQMQAGPTTISVFDIQGRAIAHVPTHINQPQHTLHLTLSTTTAQVLMIVAHNPTQKLTTKVWYR